MFEKIKEMFKKTKTPSEVTVQTAPIEVNPPQNKLVNRKEARLNRLLTIKDPSKEVKAEIASLKEALKG